MAHGEVLQVRGKWSSCLYLFWLPNYTQSILLMKSNYRDKHITPVFLIERHYLLVDWLVDQRQFSLRRPEANHGWHSLVSVHIFLLLLFCFLRLGSVTGLEFAKQASKPWGLPCPCLPSPGITGVLCWSRLLGIKTRALPYWLNKSSQLHPLVSFMEAKHMGMLVHIPTLPSS